MKKLLFIYNPHSGNGRVCQNLSAILETFTRAGYRVTVHPTQRAHDAVETAAAEGALYDRVVCSGGDGTLSETAAGLMRLPFDLRPELGFIPAGTTNDCARNLMLPHGMQEAAETAVNGFPVLTDMGQLNGRSFFYVAAFGDFTDVAYNTSQDLKKVFGHAAYILAMVNSIPELTFYPLRIEYDGGVIEDDFLVGLVCNSLSVGGVEALPPEQVSLSDGLFEVLLLKTMGNVLQVGEVLHSAMARKPAGAEEPGKLLLLHTSHLRITSRDGTPLPWTIDGEAGGAYTESTLTNRARSIRVIHGRPEKV